MDPETIPSLMLSNSHTEGTQEDVDALSEHLEVVFEVEHSHRRKSSLSMQSTRPSLARKSTSCFVHGLFQDERLTGSNHEPHAEGHPSNRTLDKVSEGVSGHPGQRKSRTLTKKELSDMAFSIRELSKRLGRFRLKLKVKNVFLLTKAHDVELIGYTRQVAEWLMSAESGGPYTVWVENTLEDNEKFDAKGLVSSGADEARLKFWTNELCAEQPHQFDIVLALGGDGTVLYASWIFQKIVPPVLSFALGSLGFLTKFDFGSYKKTLHNAFAEGLTVSLRLRLEATIMRSQNRQNRENAQPPDLIDELIGEEADDNQTHSPDETHDILNDLVLDRGPNPTMSSIEVFGDDFHITSVQADGVCVATPTGSTAYNLAAGGSLCHPDNPVVLVTAICAHTLSFRPIILPDTIVLRLGVPYDARASCWVSFDGKSRVELKQGDYVTISASRFPFPTVLPLGRGSEDWIDSLSHTLNWNSRQKQKAFKEWDDK